MALAGDLRDFVKEQRSRSRSIKATGFAAIRVGERPSLETEQLTFEQRFRNGSQIDGDKRRFAAAAEVMKRSCDQFLARPALALDQHRRIGIGDLSNLVKQFLHPGAFADDARNFSSHGQAVSQCMIFGAKLAVLNRATNLLANQIQIDRLGDEVKRAPSHRFDRHFDSAMRGDHDDRHARITLRRDVDQFQPIAVAGKAHVGDHGIEMIRFQQVQRTIDIAGGFDRSHFVL